MKIVNIKTIDEKRQLMHLLLDADPCREMLEKYLEKGDTIAIEDNGKMVCVAVVLPLNERQCELKNLAVLPEEQRKGWGSKIIRIINDKYTNKFSELLVGTAKAGVPFYERNGFVYAYTVSNFFIDNYPEPIYDQGEQCVDMIYLKRALGAPTL